jgi:thiol-disulfide isomerase/thioredoxin
MPKSKRQRRATSATSSGGAASATATRPATNGATAKSTSIGGVTRAASTASATSASRLSEIRARSGVAPRPAPRGAANQRRYARHLPWWRRNLAALGSVAAVVVIVLAFIFIQQRNNTVASLNLLDPAPQSMLTKLSGVSSTTAATVGTGGVDIGLEGTPPNVSVLTSKGLPEIVYVGAEYCPYCAAERWGMIIALDRFGSFTGVKLMKSSSGDAFPNTATFTFRNATYTSKYIVFNATETQDRSQGTLDTPPTEALDAFTAYDTAPYTNQQGGIPFVSYANQYVTTAGPFTPTMMANLTWQQVADQLNDPNSAVAKNIIGAANEQTAVICKLTNNQPTNVCSAKYIQTIEAALPTR